MNKLYLVLLVPAFFFCLNTQAQKTCNKCVKKSRYKRILTKSTRDTVIMNFKVCKSDNGYAICGEVPGTNNSTFEAPVKPKKHPAYEAAKTDVIILKGIKEIPRAPFPMNRPGPETQSGAWLGINSWNGIW